MAITAWLARGGAVLVANPTAHSGSAAEGLRHARALLDGAGIPHQFAPTLPDGGTVGLVRDRVDAGARVVIYMGGDGTFAEVAKGILASRHAGEVAMGMLPTGTANDQGKSFGLAAGPGALARNVAVLAAGVTVGCDVGDLAIGRGDRTIHRDQFFDSFSVGLGAAALATRNRDRELVGRIPGLGAVYRDHLVYAGAVLKRFAESYVVDVKFDCDAIVDGVHHDLAHLLDAIVKNTRVFGGEWVFDPDGESDDGRFELLPVTGRRDFGTKLIGSLRRSPVGLDDLGELGLVHAPAMTAARIELAIRGGALPAAQCDGEELPAGDRYVIAVRPRALRLVVPREEVEPSAASSLPGTTPPRGV